MRDLVDPVRLDRLMAELGQRARGPGRIDLTGGATALLYGWRQPIRQGSVEFFHFDFVSQCTSDSGH